MGTALKSAPGIEDVRMLSVGEVSRLLKVGRTNLFGLISRKKNPLPSVRIGKLRRFPFDKVRFWMENLEK